MLRQILFWLLEYSLFGNHKRLLNPSRILGGKMRDNVIILDISDRDQIGQKRKTNKTLIVFFVIITKALKKWFFFLKNTWVNDLNWNELCLIMSVTDRDKVYCWGHWTGSKQQASSLFSFSSFQAPSSTSYWHSSIEIQLGKAGTSASHNKEQYRRLGSKFIIQHTCHWYESIRHY